MLLIGSLLFHYRGGRIGALSSEYKINQADFTVRLPFQPSSPVEIITPNPETLSANT